MPPGTGTSSNLLALLGRKGFGKSFLAKQYARGASRVVVFDPHYEYEPAEVGPGTVEVQGVQELPDLVRPELDTYRVIFRPEDELEDFPDVMALLFFMRRTLVVVDEAEEWYQRGDVPVEFRRAIGRSRKLGNCYVLVGHYATEIPVKFRALCDWRIFRTTYVPDLELYAKLGASEAALERIPKLQRGEFLCLPDKEG